MAKCRLALRARIELRRQSGQPPIAIARYVHGRCGTNWSKKIHWPSPERDELERLDRGAVDRKIEKARRVAATVEAVGRNLACRAPPPPRPSNLGRRGMSPAEVRETLECSATELDRWSKDGRMPPDGERFYYGVGPCGGSKWGRAWLPTTIGTSKALVKQWRLEDYSEVARHWASEGSLFDLVQSRFPDAVSQWSPDWLGRQSVDIYIPSINTAVEYQGEQHYRPVSYFGGEDSFRTTQARDARKRRQLAIHGVALIEWRFDKPIVEFELDRALAFVKAGLKWPRVGQRAYLRPTFVR